MALDTDRTSPFSCAVGLNRLRTEHRALPSWSAVSSPNETSPISLGAFLSLDDALRCMDLKGGAVPWTRRGRPRQRRAPRRTSPFFMRRRSARHMVHGGPAGRAAARPRDEMEKGDVLLLGGADPGESVPALKWAMFGASSGLWFDGWTGRGPLPGRYADVAAVQGLAADGARGSVGGFGPMTLTRQAMGRRSHRRGPGFRNPRGCTRFF